MTLIARDLDLERDELDRIERVSGVRGFAARVTARMDEVERLGGPDAPARSATDAIRGALEEAIDGAAWLLVAGSKAIDEMRVGQLDEAVVLETSVLVQDAMVAFARATEPLLGALLVHGQEP